MIRELIIKNRSYRRFDESVNIENEAIKKWIELARFSASGRNMQPLKFTVCTSENVVNKIFPNLGWAGYLADWDGPMKGERPTAYIVVVHDITISQNYFCDDGIAMQSILLGAVEDGFGGCIFGTVNRGNVAKIISLPENMEILWVIALGKPVEEVALEEARDNDIKYWRDGNQVHHVPKRPLNELIIRNL